MCEIYQHFEEFFNYQKKILIRLLSYCIFGWTKNNFNFQKIGDLNVENHIDKKLKLLQIILM